MGRGVIETWRNEESIEIWLNRERERGLILRGVIKDLFYYSLIWVDYHTPGKELIKEDKYTEIVVNDFVIEILFKNVPQSTEKH